MLNNLKLENVLKILSQNKQKWLKLDIQKKISYLEQAMENLLKESKQWSEISARAKADQPSNDLIGQELLVGPSIVMRQMRFLIQALRANGMPSPLRISQKENSQFVAKVMPENFKESIIWRGFQAEIWIQKGKSPAQGSCYQKLNSIPALSLVLGAGNVSSISPLDALHKLYVEGKVCIVKLNPVNDYLLEVLNKVFSKLIHDGFLSFVKGGSDVGEWLCEHNLIDDIHITGSHHTHDKIVWGAGNQEEIQERKSKGILHCNKGVTSELGCVTPVILVPGVWSDSDLIFQARQIASAVGNNASFNCNAMKVIVTCKGWQQRDLFLGYLREELKSLPPFKAYYPGAWDRYSGFLNQYKNSEVLGEKKEGCIPWTLIPNIQENPYAFQEEAFCGVVAETSLASDTVPEFIHKAVEFCNDKIWGTLSCSLLVDPLTESIHRNDIEQAIELLRYGSIGINCWAALSYAFAATTWGAYPGSSLINIQSGIGCVHNGLLFDYPEKSVVRAPFRIWPNPAWFYTNKNPIGIGKCLIQYEYSQSTKDFMKLVFAALKG
jgi:Aldehyde dehydrogenase family